MGRFLSLALVVAAAAADARDRHQLAFYLLVGAVPAAAVTALSSLGDLAELPGRAPGEWAARVQALLAALGLLGVVVAAAARAQAADATPVPALGVSALLACLCLFALHGLVALRAAPPSRDG